ncbi:hypothetical protein O7626_15215 [Micromonospora sp. WMMD1102]|uniref:hypothetical protein n=1 Tax=Micromonospora sp. WMMD1102 TaxID=3016105 RepID=UPI0024152198|nr:hypothetical protein [Micromonospora sp. WMMD1102]MDG4787264.1 hypothetical protein [Micromonospora sp. WMMD1102]
MEAERRPPARWPVVRVGDVFTLRQADYCYGRGDIRIRVTAVPANADLLALEGVHLRARAQRHDGTEGPEYFYLCRVRALRESLPERPGPGRE